ncbi:DUF5677 domain-containing protein [Bacillus tropicus]|uniref:DUF5677 domain-containing protein n=1 Tax=Bacillus tropicus TaxID=2026188 RepID=UPI003D1C7D8E
MYKEFLRDVIKNINSDENTGGDSLSRIIFLSWINKNLKNDNQGAFEKKLIETIKNLGKDDLGEDEEVADLLFLFGYKMREDLRLEGIGFNNSLLQHYGLEFYYLELIEILTRELGHIFSKNIESDEQDTSMEFLLHQHIRACSIYSEIIYLIKGGYGTGAITRFRSLHELAVISEFVIESGEEAAECYFDYLPVMQMKDYIYQKKILGESPNSEMDKKELLILLKEIEMRRGKEFVNPREFNDYIWAKSFLKEGQNPSFNQIRRSIKRKHGLKPYKIASNNIHSAPKSIISSLSTYDGTFAGGASNIGVSLAGTWGTYEILQMNRLIFSYIVQAEFTELIDKMQSMLILKMMNYLAKLLYDNFPDKEQELLEGIEG